MPSDKEVLIDAPRLSDITFVYGEQVNDFCTAQELSKLIKQQQAEIDFDSRRILSLQD